MRNPIPTPTEEIVWRIEKIDAVMDDIQRAALETREWIKEVIKTYAPREGEAPNLEFGLMQMLKASNRAQKAQFELTQQTLALMEMQVEALKRRDVVATDLPKFPKFSRFDGV